eukprot:164673-Chlamydomonas_euryale.AAC.1
MDGALGAALPAPLARADVCCSARRRPLSSLRTGRRSAPWRWTRWSTAGWSFGRAWRAGRGLPLPRTR